MPTKRCGESLHAFIITTGYVYPWKIADTVTQVAIVINTSRTMGTTRRARGCQWQTADTKPGQLPSAICQCVIYYLPVSR